MPASVSKKDLPNKAADNQLMRTEGYNPMHQAERIDQVGTVAGEEQTKQRKVRGTLNTWQRRRKVEKPNQDTVGNKDPCVFLKETSTINESMDVNGFHVLPSQVDSVRRLFERHPDIAVRFGAKNQLLRNSCMNSLLGIIETLCQPFQDISNEDLVGAEIALTYVKDSGFKVDWLEKKLDQVKEMKERDLCGFAILQETEESLKKLKQQCAETEESLKKLKQQCADLEALAEEQKTELLATRTPLSFDDVV